MSPTPRRRDRQAAQPDARAALMKSVRAGDLIGAVEEEAQLRSHQVFFLGGAGCFFMLQVFLPYAEIWAGVLSDQRVPRVLFSML